MGLETCEGPKPTPNLSSTFVPDRSLEWTIKAEQDALTGDLFAKLVHSAGN